MVEPIEMPTRDEVKSYLPDYEPQQHLDIDNPISMGPVGMPEVYTESKMAGEEAIQKSYRPIMEAFDGFAKRFGRQYKPIETYRSEDAEVLVVSMGGISETAMSWVDRQRDKGEKVGLVRFRLWRPLPVDDFIAAVRHAKSLVVVDRHFSPGGAGGPVAQEIKTMLYNSERRIPLAEFVAGLGGRDVSYDDFDTMYVRGKSIAAGGEIPPFELIQARGGHYGEV
jgi:pyruvate ferredoxin oxidoreductase alpha subunit